MKYKSDIYDSDIAEMLHEKATLEFKLGLISEAQMRKYDKLCLTKKALKNKAAQRATANIEHADLITA
jgi:DNA-binding transcriptional regulator YiaG